MTSQINPIVQQIISLCDSKKASNIIAYQLNAPLFVEYTLVATGHNPIHVKSLAQDIEKAIKSGEINVVDPRVSGNPNSGWVIVECPGIVTIHLLLSDVRDFYDLDGLYSRRAIAFHH
ncbi:ribosome silencing factor [bacterium]|nr:ribosome silencing factor [bacterium]